MGDKDKITVTLDDYVSGEDITIDLNDTYGTTTTYWAGDSVTDITVSPSDGTYTLDLGDLMRDDTIDISNITSDWKFTDNSIDPDKVERMCKEYPSLEKVWRNFKAVYDMVQQDYEGKKKAGEIDDDDELPF